MRTHRTLTTASAQVAASTRARRARLRLRQASAARDAAANTLDGTLDDVDPAVAGKARRQAGSAAGDLRQANPGMDAAAEPARPAAADGPRPLPLIRVRHSGQGLERLLAHIRARN